MTRRQVQEHVARVRQMPCLACEIEGVDQPNPSEGHHPNTGGHAGQKRLGDGIVIPLCGWHHRSVQKPGCSSIDMAESYGPSLAKQSKKFRERYGSDPELLAMVNKRLGAT